MSFLTPEQYWKWRLTIEEMNHAETKVALLKSKVDIKKLEGALSATYVKDAMVESDKIKNEYSIMKKELEQDIGVSMNDAIIDGHTYEVKQIKGG